MGLLWDDQAKGPREPAFHNAGNQQKKASVETKLPRTPHPTCGGQKSGYHPPGREAYYDETTSEALVTTVRSAMRGTSSLAPIVS